MTDKALKTILITGASSGLGEALALRYAKDKKHLILTGRNAERLKNVAEKCREIGATAHDHIIDVADQHAMRKMILTENNFTPVDLVIANAGISGGTGDKNIESDQQTKAILDINIYGVLNTIEPLLPIMTKRQSGHIAAVSSLAGYHGFPGAGAYCASKAAVKSFCESWRVALKSDNVHVSCIMPGFVITPMTDANGFNMPLMITAEKAADLIVNRLAKKHKVIAFPWPTRLGSWFISILPAWISDRLLKNAPSKPIMKND